MLSAKDMAHLLGRAKRNGTRLVLVGDTKQLGSVEAGRAFEQLQQAGMPTFALEKIVRQTNEHTLAAVEALIAGDAAEAFARLDAGGGAITEHPDPDIRRAMLVRDFLKLDPLERAGAIILDLTRDGRKQLAESLRAGLLREGSLGDDALTTTVLESRNIGPADRKRALSYDVGDVVTFRQSYPKRGIATGTGYKVETVYGKTVRLTDPKGKAVDWQPASWGAASAEVFTELETEFRPGDRIQFTRNNHRINRRNGMVATIAEVHPDKNAARIIMADGLNQLINLNRLADRHVRQGWVQTVHASQGATADRVFVHLESFRRPVDARALYVAISRARDQAHLYTDNRDRLAMAVETRDGKKAAALDDELDQDWSMGLG